MGGPVKGKKRKKSFTGGSLFDSDPEIKGWKCAHCQLGITGKDAFDKMRNHGSDFHPEIFQNGKWSMFALFNQGGL